MTAGAATRSTGSTALGGDIDRIHDLAIEHLRYVGTVQFVTHDH